MKRWLLALLLTGCIDTTIESTTIALSASGTDASAPFEGRNGAMITLERADVAFGPLYLCTGAMAGALCDEAIAQWTDAEVVDALDPTSMELGSMTALTGTTRSYMYDLGISSLLTRDQPLVSPAAESLGPASVVVEGRAEVDGQTIPFSVAVRVEQSNEVERGVPVIRSGMGDGFSEEVLPDGRSSLEVRFDPRPWLATANFSSLTEDGACAPEVDVVCAGSLEQTCADDGSVMATDDCADRGEACVRGLGCVERVELAPDSQIGRALRSGVEAGQRPELVFEQN